MALKKVLLEGKLLHPRDYLAAIEFGGRDVTLTIAGISREELKMQNGKKEVQPVMTFRETPKKLVVNKTNADSIATLYGVRAEDWVGKRITLYPTRVPCGSEMREAIRVRETAPKDKGAPSVPATDHDEAPKPGPITAADVDAVLGGGQ